MEEYYKILKKKRGIYEGKKGWFLVRERINTETYLLDKTFLEIDVCFTLEETILLQVVKLGFYLTEKQMEEYKKGKLSFLRKLMKEYL
ncbi:hypothetical protein J7K25_07580 [bacterium]|nr:hypothetical protein [bacterium]